MFLKFIILLLLTVLVIANFSANAQSFSCADPKNLNVTEQTICSDAKLLALDNSLSALYNKAITLSPDAKSLKADQQEWLIQNRNLCANDKKCLTDVYQSRTHILSTLIANPSAKMPKTYPVRWDHSIDMPPNSAKFKKLIDSSLDYSNPGLSSKNSCIQFFLKYSIPAQHSTHYHFTKNTLYELPPNIGDTPDDGMNTAWVVKEFLAGKSRKEMDPGAKIIYLSPYELLFTITKSSNELIFLKIVAWGDFSDCHIAGHGKYCHKHDGWEDMLLYVDNDLYRKPFDRLQTYVVITQKNNEKRVRTIGFYDADYYYKNNSSDGGKKDCFRFQDDFIHKKWYDIMYATTFNLKFPFD